MHRTITTLLTLTIICTTACVDDDECTTDDCADPGGPGGKADETHPTATTGTLTVHALPGTAPISLVAIRQDSFVHTIVSLPAGSTRSLSPGRYCLRATLGSGMQLGEDCTITIEALIATEYDLGSLRFVHGRDEIVYGWDLAPATTAAETFSRQSQPISHPAGAFSYSLDIAPTSLAVMISQAGETTVDVTSLPGASAVRLLPSQNRVLPNAPITHPGTWLCTRTTIANRCFSFHPIDKPLLWPRANMETDLRFTGISRSVTSTTAAFAFPTTSGIRDVQLRRIDLNHPRVTLANGSVVTIPGKADIQLVQNAEGNPSSAMLVLSQPTGYGVDVPPGRYDVTTSFIHPADNSPVVVHEILDLR